MAEMTAREALTRAMEICLDVATSLRHEAKQHRDRDWYASASALSTEAKGAGQCADELRALRDSLPQSGAPASAPMDIEKALSHALNYHGIDAKCGEADYAIAMRLAPQVMEILSQSQPPASAGAKVVEGRILFSDDAHCPGCGHNRDRSSISTVALLDGRRECQMCGALWSEIDRLAAAPSADDSNG